MDATNIANPPNREAVMRETRVIGIDGMTCDRCVQHVERALRGVNGVQEVRVDRGAARAEVTFDRQQTDMPALHDAVLKSGYIPRREPAA
jgi:copper chaperone